MFTPAASLVAQRLRKTQRSLRAPPVASPAHPSRSFSTALNYHIDPPDKNSDIPREFTEANLERAVATEERAKAAEDRAEATNGWAKAAKDHVKAAEERAASVATRAVEEYKDSDDFVVDAAEAGKNAYVFGFDDCKKMVTTELGPARYRNIGRRRGCSRGRRGGRAEEEEGEIREQAAEETGADEEVIEVPVSEAATIGVVEEVIEVPASEAAATEAPRKVAAPAEASKEVAAPAEAPREVASLTEIPEEAAAVPEA